MDPKLVRIVQIGWHRVEQFGVEAFGCTLFKKIFELDPFFVMFYPFQDQKDIYNSPVFKQHGQKIATTIGEVIKQLDKDLSGVMQRMMKLGARHVKFNARPENFATVGKAFVDSVALYSGQDFTEEIRSAWVTLFKFLTTMMVGHHVPMTLDEEEEEEKKTVSPPPQSRTAAPLKKAEKNVDAPNNGTRIKTRAFLI